MSTAILRGVLGVLIGAFVGVVGVSVWFATTGDIALLVWIAVLGALIGFPGLVACVLAWVAVVNSEN